LDSTEANALKRFVNEDHDHLIKLLATFIHRGEFNLILPHADGNLKDFWMRYHPDANALTRDHGLAIWLVKQMHGLSSAIMKIHGAHVGDTNGGTLAKDGLNKKHGRHGDLKPENILWFKDSWNQSGQSLNSLLGILKISDFGSADFHGTHSLHVPLRHVHSYTPTYRAPECDLAKYEPEEGLVSPAYDIWCLGCVFLEFVTWYLQGWHGPKGVDGFSTRRKEESLISELKEDNYFHMAQDSRTAVLKSSVTEVSYQAFMQRKV
jgi:serine/threonine protein kinase